MKRLLFILILPLLLTYGCKEDETISYGGLEGVLYNTYGEPLENANVFLKQGEGIVADDLTGEDGSFSFSELMPGTYKIYAFHSVYKESKETEVIIESGQVKSMDLNFMPVISIKGLFYGTNGLPEAGQLIQLYEVTGQKSMEPIYLTFTDEFGYFYFYQLPEGVYKIVIESEGGRIIEQLARAGDEQTQPFVFTFAEELGEFTDSRDGNEYKWVKIGEQTWMAENLAYLPQVDRLADGSEDDGYTGKYYYVYGYQPDVADDEDTQVNKAKQIDSYDTFGVLYSWNAALGDDSPSTSNPSGVQGVCPDGWHLPSYNEWYELRNYVEGQADESAGILLKSEGNIQDGTGLWEKSGDEGLDEFGFNGLPHGRRNSNGSGFYSQGYYGRFWTASQNSWYRGYYFYLHYNQSILYGAYAYHKSYGLGVRCVKDE